MIIIIFGPDAIVIKISDKEQIPLLSQFQEVSHLSCQYGDGAEYANDYNQLFCI